MSKLLRTIPFKKMNGLGNDFVVIDARAEPLALPSAFVVKIADRTEGVGCDQVIVLERSRAADVFMRILNADGSEVGACGNASRCVAAMLKPALGRDGITIQTEAGVLSARVAESGFVTVDMGVPRFAWQDIPLARPIADTREVELAYDLPDGRRLEGPSLVNVGNPHCIFWVGDVESYDLAAFGAELEHHPLFPERANISLAETSSGEGAGKERIVLRVWERGAGLTKACGTAACAATVASARIGRTGRRALVSLPGGELAIEWRASDDHMLMSGPTEFEFDGLLRVSEDGGSIEVARLS